MVPRELFQSFMDARGENPTSLARAVTKQGVRVTQSTIHRYVKDGTENPRARWLEAVAVYWGLPPDTFSSPARAAEVAAQLNLQAAPQDAGPLRVARIKPRPGIDPGLVVELIAELARGLTPVSREAAAALLSGAMRHPDEAASIAISLRGLVQSAKRPAA